MKHAKSLSPRNPVTDCSSKEIQYLLKSIRTEPKGIIVDYGCADSGQMGVCVAHRFSESAVILVASNIKAANAAKKSIEENRLENISLEIGTDLDFLLDRKLAAVIIKPAEYESKEQLKNKIAESMDRLEHNGQLYIVAHMRSGASSLMKMVDEIFGKHTILEKGGGGIRIIGATKSFSGSPVVATEQDTERIEVTILDKNYIFETASDLFSKEQLDNGSRLLIHSVNVHDARSILDLGCGYGAIGIVMADQHPSATVTLLDIDAKATRAAERNARLNHVAGNTKIVLNDGIAGVSGRSFDLILSHFPLHIPKDDQIRLVTEARDALVANGRFCLVALVAYDLRPLLQDVFGNLEIIADTSGHSNPKERYRVLCSTKR